MRHGSKAINKGEVIDFLEGKGNYKVGMEKNRVKIEDVIKIIKEENLVGYNMNEERNNRENEVVLRHEDDKWIVYVTDERASKIINSQDTYSDEEEALYDFADRLRADKILREL